MCLQPKMPTPARLVVAVGSRNPVKVNAVKSAFAAAFPTAQLDISMHDVPSGVPDQPWGDGQTRQGALNRALACHVAHTEACGCQPDFSVGLEGGVLEEHFGELHPSIPGAKSTVSCFAFMAILSMSGPADARWGIARTASFPLPPRIVALMRGRGGEPPMELGDADDKVFGEINSKQKGGTVAKVTNGMIDRTAYYEHALVCALSPFLHDETALYADT